MERISLGKLTAACTLIALAVVLIANGQQMFSPGALSVKARSKTTRGGVASHGEIQSCSACHVAPWSAATMSSRCLDCHTEVQAQLDAHGPLHGLLAKGMECRACHTEHKGAHAQLTDFSLFDHDCTGFKLTGKHRAVACASCHTGVSYKGVAHSCQACHAEPESHRGRYGTDCARCHTTEQWTGARFTHSFPLNHGVGKKKTSACVTCHNDAADMTNYTCSNCHRHKPENTEKRHFKLGIDDVSHCALCHPTGRRARKAAADVERPALAAHWYLDDIRALLGGRPAPH